MVDERLVEYLRRMEEQGRSTAEVYDALISNGYSTADIAKASELARSKPNRIAQIMLGAIVFLLIAGITTVAFFVFRAEPICNVDVDCDDGVASTLDFCTEPGSRGASCTNAPEVALSDSASEIAFSANEPIALILDNEKRIVSARSDSDDSASIEIDGSAPVTVSTGSSRSFDADGDGTDDVSMTLVRFDNETPVFAMRSLERANALTLSIEPSKETYEMGEQVTGSVSVEHTGEPFSGFIVLTRQREGIDNAKHSISLARISSDPIPVPQFYAFRMNEYEYSAPKDVFYEEGTYQYTLSVYSCDEAESKLAITCDNMRDRYLDELKPVSSVTTTVTVQGGVNPSECRSRIDCTTPCEGCESGTQICEQSDEECIDCFIDSHCSSGYSCVERECVADGCTSDSDCSDGNAATTDTCEAGVCTNEPITTCTDSDDHCPAGCTYANDVDCDPPPENEPIEDVSETVDTPSDEATEPESTCGTAIVDCGTSEFGSAGAGFECFAEQVETCCPSTLVSTIEVELFGTLATTVTYRELEGWEGDRCVLYERAEDVHYEYTDETRQQLLDSNLSEAEIDAQLAEQNAAADEMIGDEGRCRYPPEDLISKLDNEVAGSIGGSMTQYAEYSCEGALYE